MEENQKSPLFTELTDSEAESLSGGSRFTRILGAATTIVGAGLVATGVGAPLGGVLILAGATIYTVGENLD